MRGCCICGGALRPCARFDPQPFFECEDCGFIFRPDLDEAALRRVYAEGGYEEMRGEQYLAELAHRRRDARVRLSYVEPWARSGRLLDVGAAGGAFVAEAAARGFEASGIEPVPSFARAAREQLGLDVREGAIGDVELDADRYEVITLWHVLEHLPDPVAHLTRLKSALSPGGVLALEVPNAGSAVARHMGAAWPSLEPQVHVNQFTPQSLRAALSTQGSRFDGWARPPSPPICAPREAASRPSGRPLKAAVWLATPREHAEGHELLRAVAQRS